MTLRCAASGVPSPVIQVKKLTFFGSQVKVPDDDHHDKAYDDDIMIKRFSGTSQWDLCLLVGRLGVKELASLSHSSQGFHHRHRHHHLLLHRHHRRHRCHRHDDGKQVRSWGLYVHCKQRSGTSSTRHNHFIGSM